MSDAADRRFQEYSTGMKQRMGLARGLLADPEIFFMDEPTKGLDPIAAWQLHEFIRNQLADAGKTVILATHHLAEAEQVCDRVGHHVRRRDARQRPGEGADRRCLTDRTSSGTWWNRPWSKRSGDLE